jgi:hypothetical protein
LAIGFVAGFLTCPSKPSTTAACRGWCRRSRRVQLAVAERRVRLADGTLISCANYPGCASRSRFAGAASYGYSPSESQFIWSVRLVVVSDPKGVPVGYDLVGPKTGEERESVLELAFAQAGSILFCDNGLWGRELATMLELTEVELITPERHRLGQRPPAEVAKARIRLVIASVFANLKGQMRLDNHLAKTVGGMVQRVAQRLLARILGIFWQPARRSAGESARPYDGR